MTASDLSLSTVTTRAGFAGLCGEWDPLVEELPRPSPYLLHGWLEAWSRTFLEDGALRVLVARQQGRLVGALPLCVRRRHGLRVAEFVGGADSALADILLAPGAPAETATRLAAAAAGGDHDYADLFGLPGQSRLASALPAGALETVERADAPVIDLTDGWEAVYERTTSAKRRKLHRKRLRQLSELGAVELRVSRTEDELAGALEDAVALHRMRFNGRPDASGFSTPAGIRFHREAFAALAAQDVPRIVTLTLDGRPVAFHCYLAFAGRMVCHRLAFDPELGRFSPGLLTTLEAIRLASEEGLRRVEFLGGDERYKLELCDRLEPLQQGLGLACGPLGRTAVSARIAGIRLRRRLKRSSALRRLYVDGLAPSRRLAASLRQGGAEA